MTLTLLRHAHREPEDARQHVANAIMLLGALEHEVGVAQASSVPGANQPNIAACFADVSRRLGDALAWLDARRSSEGTIVEHAREVGAL